MCVVDTSFEHCNWLESFCGYFCTLQAAAERKCVLPTVVSIRKVYLKGVQSPEHWLRLNVLGPQKGLMMSICPNSLQISYNLQTIGTCHMGCVGTACNQKLNCWSIKFLIHKGNGLLFIPPNTYKSFHMLQSLKCVMNNGNILREPTIFGNYLNM